MAALYLAFVTMFVIKLDPDFGWHLEAGRYILAHGVPAHDMFTYTAASFPWIDHEWLSNVITALLMGAGGLGLTAAVFAGVWTAALALAARVVRWPVLALGFVAVSGDAVVRPHAFTALFLAGLLVMLDGKHLVEGRRRWWLVPYFALWANLHAGFVLGFVAVAMAAVRRRELRLVGVAAALATFINPYGPRLYEEIWRTLSDPALHTAVAEWRPLAIGVASGLYLVAFLAAGAARGWRRESMAFPLLVLAAAVIEQRHFMLFVVASLGVVSEAYGGFERLVRRHFRWLVPVVGAAAAIAIVVPVYVTSRHPQSYVAPQSMANLRARPCTGNLFNDYDFGGYVIWQLPGTKVYIDGRMPSWNWHGVSYMQRWAAAVVGGPAADREFAAYNVQCALLEPRRTKLIGQLKDEGWRVTATDPIAVLLRKP